VRENLTKLNYKPDLKKKARDDQDWNILQPRKTI